MLGAKLLEVVLLNSLFAVMFSVLGNISFSTCVYLDFLLLMCDVIVELSLFLPANFALLFVGDFLFLLMNFGQYTPISCHVYLSFFKLMIL